MALRGAGLRVCQFPARAWLLEANNRRWLWDTGYASHFIDHTRSGIFRLYARLTPVYFSPQQALVAQLRQAGYQPGDIQGLIISHFHGDHIAGLHDFPGVPMIGSGEGWQKTRALRGFRALKNAFVPGLIPSDFESRLRFVEGFERVALPAELRPFEHGWCLPESNGEILLVALPGHAAGHLGAFIQQDDGWTLLASDAAWCPDNYQQLRGPSRLANLIMDDSAAYYHTLNLLHQLWRGGRVRILLCHEGDL
jgi:glyoxylase-like metal-dependent hydrolase (beta-lactamase superfamily II)